MVPGVHFQEPDEFLMELERDIEDQLAEVDRGIVRATYMYRQAAVGIRTVTVLASYLSVRPGALPLIVHLQADAGQLWGNADDERTRERRDSILAAIRQACERLGLEVRAGTLAGGWTRP